jgi:hypothetical protein
MYPTISLDPALAQKLEAGMRMSDVIELPFPAPYLWALNGQPSYKSQGGALYYGGWATKAEDVDALIGASDLPVPAEWKRATIALRDGGEFEAYTTRNLIVAPIGKRESWLLDGKRSSEYMEGGRRHIQALCYLAEGIGDAGNRQFQPWGPVVLTAKGYQARNLLDAFSKWERATATLRWKVAPKVPAWCFYLSLGTFGRERQALNVGKPGAQSPITPIGAYISDRLDESMIANLFVGQEVAEHMAELQDQAAEWLGAWQDPALSPLLDDFSDAASHHVGEAFEDEQIPF